MKRKFFYLEDDGCALSVWEETKNGDELIEEVYNVDFSFDGLNEIANNVLRKKELIGNGETYFK